jgi:hypothetical protein
MADNQLESAPVKAVSVRPYRRLPGLRFNGASARAVLRLGNDHLLQCDYRSGFVERYKRFYFRDIQAFIIRKTSQWLVAITIWTLVGGLFLLIANSAHWNRYVTLTLEGICLLFIARNLIRGPSCRTHIQTAVQTDLLPMLKRTRKTERVLRAVFPLINEAQSTTEPIAPAVRTVLPAISSAMPAAAQVTEQPTATERARLSLLHLITFALLLLAGGAAIWEVNFPSTLSYGVLLGLFSVIVLLGVIALIWQARRPVHRSAAVMTWLLVISYVFGGVAVNAGFTWFDMILQIRMQSALRTSQPPQFHQISPFRMRHLPGFENVLWVFGIWSVLLGLLGLICVFLPAPAKAQPPPLPQPNRP